MKTVFFILLFGVSFGVYAQTGTSTANADSLKKEEVSPTSDSKGTFEKPVVIMEHPVKDVEKPQQK